MIEIITSEDLEQLTIQAKNAPRLRANLNVHKTLEAGVQRLFIATEPGTYIRPHRHPQPDKWEFFVILEGQIDLLIFDQDGNVLQRVSMTPSSTRAVEVPANVWHTYVCMRTGTMALEIKQGAYIQPTEKDFASWAPAENTDEVGAYLHWLREAHPI
jgi:cupin fold WbuC family metalloprotein